MTLIIYILSVHYIADFILQTDKQATGKSSSWLPLLDHVVTYGTSLWICVLAYSYFDKSLTGAFTYALWNALAHLVTDFISSRVGKARWEAGDRRGFFMVVGADQLAHQLCLILSIPLFLVR